MENNKKCLTLILTMIFVSVYKILIINAEDISNLFSYKSQTINCTYEISMYANQSENDGNRYLLNMTFASKIVDAGVYDSDYSGTGMIVWDINSYEVIEGPSSKLTLRVNSNKSDFNDLMTPKAVALSPKGNVFLDNYSSNSGENKLKFRDQLTNIDYTSCPDLSFAQENTSTGLTLYPSEYGNWDQSMKLIKMMKVNNDGSYNIEDKTQNSSSYSECVSDIKIFNGNTATSVVNMKVRVYENGGYSISLDGQSFTPVYDTGSEDLVWSGSTTEVTDTNVLGNTASGKRTVKIHRKSWESIKSQIGYEKCKEDPNFTVTLSEREDVNMGKNELELSKDTLSESNGGTGKTLGTGTGKVNTSGDSDFLPQTIISTDPAYCRDLLDDELISFIQSAWTIVKVASIVICVLFGVIDFISSASSSKDKLMESLNKTIKRLIIVIIILLLPTIIDIIGDILGQSDILCGIR